MHKTMPQTLQRNQNHGIPLHIEKDTCIFPSEQYCWFCSIRFQKNRIHQFLPHTCNVPVTSATNTFGFPGKNGSGNCPVPVLSCIDGKILRLATGICNKPESHPLIRMYPCWEKPEALSDFQMLFRDNLKELRHFQFRWVFPHTGTHNIFDFSLSQGENQNL